MERKTIKAFIWSTLSVLTVAIMFIGVSAPAQAQGKKPNIVIIWGDDIGQSNISAYSNTG